MLAVFNDGFDYVDTFFKSLDNYLNYNSILLTCLAIFIVAFLIVLITTSQSYEAKLIRSIDMFNNYFMKTPEINADNLLEFNNKMKSRRVPKQLRKQWQQYVLYRDKSASEYMSFEICVSSPIKNSTYKRDVKILNFVTYILALLSILANLYCSWFESSNISIVLEHTLLCPILLLILNFFITIFFDFRHNAIVSDLNQNYQYFELNIDKAASTIPEYVDYELLFDKNEIKKGIPILYTYLQRRQEEEKRELERARLKNVQHEKFNFDEAGVAKSLVLERAMQEAENYIAERNKFLQDTEQINAEITQEDFNFREITKEYQREMQVSKETFDNFKAQLNDVSSSIEANYLKKQQQQELDRQRNLERDYDTATERHNQLVKALQDELDAANEQLKQARTALEKGMMSEFDSYSQKVYADAERVVKERANNVSEQQKAEINDLKAQIQSLTSLNDNLLKTQSTTPNSEDLQNQSQPAETETEYSVGTEQEENPEQDENPYQETEYSYGDTTPDEYSQPSYGEQTYQESEPAEQPSQAPVNVINDSELVSILDGMFQDGSIAQEEESAKTEGSYKPTEGEKELEASNSEKEISTEKEIESEPKKVGKRGRPRKVKTEPEAPKRPVGRPRKVKTEEELNKPKRGRGRPRKIIIIQEQDEDNGATTPSSSSQQDNSKNISVVSLTDEKNLADIDNYLQEIDNQIAEENAKMEASQKELEKNSKIRKRKK